MLERSSATCRRQGDYLVIHARHPAPLAVRPSGASEVLVIESRGHVRTPKRYRNEFGQLLEGAPYSERDIRRPLELSTHDEKGDFRILVKKYDALNELVLDHHPFDVVGWDGYYYPWAFNIHDFEPIVGRIHQPPPVHQTFQGDGFVICSFCPRPYDFDPHAVPAPYNHCNVDSDEVLYYALGEFMSRKGIEYGSVTLHPDGVPHGPHPGRAEASHRREGHQRARGDDGHLPSAQGRRSRRCRSRIRKYHQSWVEQQHAQFNPPTT